MPHLLHLIGFSMFSCYLGKKSTATSMATGPQASNMKLYEESEMQEGATTGGPEAQSLTIHYHHHP